MNPEILNELYAGAGAALAPLLWLAAGLSAVLIADVFAGLKAVRPVLVPLTLGGAAWSAGALISDPAGAVLGGSFLADARTGAFALVFLASAGLAWAQARRYYTDEAPFLGEHDALLLTAPMGMILMAGAQDLILFFVGLELLSIPLYCLSAFRRARTESVEAGLRYFVLGAFGVALFLMGAALLYTLTGSVSLEGLAAAKEALASPMGATGLALLLASLFFKAGVAPFHLWVPDVYQGAPTPIASLMATGTKAAAFAFLLRLVPALPAEAGVGLGLVAVATMAIGNLGALGQTDLKRLFAWSGVAHAGTLLLVIAGAVAAGGTEHQEAVRNAAFSATLLYVAAYAFSAGGALGLVAWMEADGEEYRSLSRWQGLGTVRPGVAAGMTLFALSLGGIPATGGFLGKWLAFSTAVRAELVPLAVLGALTSVVALGYYLRIVVDLWMRPRPEDAAAPSAERPLAAFAAGFSAAMVLALGVAPGLLLGRLIG